MRKLRESSLQVSAIGVPPEANSVCRVSDFFFFSSRRRHTRSDRDWSSDVCSSDLLIGFACTINEPQGLGLSGWVLGINPPGHKGDVEGAERATANLLEAHRRGAAAIRSRAKIPVGVCLAMPDIQYEDGAQPGESGFELESRVNDRFLDLARGDDFIGVQTYTRFRIGPEGPRGPGHDWSELSRDLVETDETTQM